MPRHPARHTAKPCGSVRWTDATTKTCPHIHWYPVTDWLDAANWSGWVLFRHHEEVFALPFPRAASAQSQSELKPLILEILEKLEPQCCPAGKLKMELEPGTSPPPDVMDFLVNYEARW